MALPLYNLNTEHQTQLPVKIQEHKMHQINLRNNLLTNQTQWTFNKGSREEMNIMDMYAF